METIWLLLPASPRRRHQLAVETRQPERRKENIETLVSDIKSNLIQLKWLPEQAGKDLGNAIGSPLPTDHQTLDGDQNSLDAVVAAEMLAVDESIPELPTE